MEASADRPLLRIGELRRRVEVSEHLLRAWESRYGLLQPARSPGGFRLYSGADESRIRAMQTYIADGLSAAEAARAALGSAAGAVPGGRAGAPAAVLAEQTEGVHLDQLLTALQPDRQAVAGALAEILRAAADTSPGQDPAIQDLLQEWQPVIAATVAAAGGDSDAAAQLTPFLDQLVQTSDWAALAAVLRRIIGGDRDASLLQGLDPVGTAITGQVLTRLAQPPDTPAQEDP